MLRFALAEMVAGRLGFSGGTGCQGQKCSEAARGAKTDEDGVVG
jgi:hypothetical protein